MKQRTLITTVVLVTLAAPQLVAQKAPDDIVRTICLEELERPESCQDVFNPLMDVGDAKGAVLEDGSSVVVAVDDKTQTASIRFTLPWLNNKISATVSASVDKDSGNAEFIGFGDELGTEKLKLEYNNIKWPEFPLYKLAGKDGGKTLNHTRWFYASACVKAAEALRAKRLEVQQLGLSKAALDALYTELAKLKESDLPSQDQIATYLNKARSGAPAPNTPPSEAEKKVQKIIKQREDEEGFCGLLESLIDKDSLYKELKLSKDQFPHQARIFGFNATVGRKKFDFLDRSLLQTDSKVDTASTHEIPTSIGIRYGWLFLTKNLEAKPKASLVFSYNREKSFKAADDVTFCQPAEGLEDFSFLESCKEIPGAAPGSTDSDLISVEYRKKFEKIGLAIRGFYRGKESKEDDFGFEIPVYFLTNKDGGLQGGVTFGWRDQDDDGSIAIFVGRKFEL